MDPALLEEAVRALVSENRKPKAIIAVHTYGMPQEMEPVLRIAQEFEIPVLEDAAEAIGAAYSGKVAGTFGDVGVLSFNSNKILTAYGGGAVVCRTAAVARQVSFRAAQSREAAPYYLHREVGYNYRMSPLNAAMAISQWDKLGELVAARRRVFDAYRKELEPRGWTFPQPGAAGANRWLTTVLVPPDRDASRRDSLLKAFAAAGIEVRPLWKPLHTQPLLEGSVCFGGAVAGDLFTRGLCLPSGLSESTYLFRVMEVLAR